MRNNLDLQDLLVCAMIFLITIIGLGAIAAIGTDIYLKFKNNGERKIHAIELKEGK